MNKQEFLKKLGNRLDALPPNEIETTKAFYSEMIDDRMDDGLEEKEAVAAIGDIDTIVNDMLLNLSLPTLIKAKIKPKRKIETWQIVLLALGFPLWAPLLIAFFATIFSVYLSVWSMIVALYSMVLGFGVGGLVGLFTLLFSNSLPVFFFMLGSSLAFIGIAILTFFGVTKLSIWLVSLTSIFLRWVKTLFIQKEA